MGILWKLFGNSLEILWEGLNIKGIDLFVRTLVFVKILGKGKKKERRIAILRSARGKLIALENIRNNSVKIWWGQVPRSGATKATQHYAKNST